MTGMLSLLNLGWISNSNLQRPIGSVGFVFLGRIFGLPPRIDLAAGSRRSCR